MTVQFISSIAQTSKTTNKQIITATPVSRGVRWWPRGRKQHLWPALSLNDQGESKETSILQTTFSKEGKYAQLTGKFHRVLSSAIVLCPSWSLCLSKQPPLGFHTLLHLRSTDSLGTNYCTGSYFTSSKQKHRAKKPTNQPATCMPHRQPHIITKTVNNYLKKKKKRCQSFQTVDGETKALFFFLP